jgi:hypothetical protein
MDPRSPCHRLGGRGEGEQGPEEDGGGDASPGGVISTHVAPHRRRKGRAVGANSYNGSEVVS